MACDLGEGIGQWTGGSAPIGRSPNVADARRAGFAGQIVAVVAPQRRMAGRPGGPDRDNDVRGNHS